jgi:acyl carrier protein
MTDALRSELRALIEDGYLHLHPGLALADEDDLLALGVIDSLGFVELVEQVEERYGIAVQDVEITEEHFGSIAAIARFVETRRTA